MTYVLWTAAYNTTFLLGYILIEMTFFPSSPQPTNPPSKPVPPLLHAINQNGLVVFLVANLLTGLVNVSMETMYMGNASALFVLALYSMGVCGLAWTIRSYRLKI